MALATGGDALIVAVIFGTVSGTIISLARMRLNYLASKREPSLTGAHMDDRLQRIEQAVDAIAIEVERMSESQRFVTKVLAERLPPASGTALPSRGEAAS
jgi:riboflavin transporter FmnP